MIDNQGNLHFYLNDHLGSARVTIDTAGTVKDRYVYFAFGGPDEQTLVTANMRRYTGKPFDRDHGLDLYYYGARYYDPSLGRFTQVDPLRGKYPSWGPYVYTLDNPMRYVDPDGMENQDAGPEDEQETQGESESNGVSSGDEPVVDLPPDWDPSTPPGEDWVWRGDPGSVPGDSKGNWHKPSTGESIHVDLDHPPGIPPHYEYYPGRKTGKIRVDPTGRPLKQDGTAGSDNSTMSEVGKTAAGAAAVVVAVVIIKKVVGACLLATPAAPAGAILILTP